MQGSAAKNGTLQPRRPQSSINTFNSEFNQMRSAMNTTNTLRLASANKVSTKKNHLKEPGNTKMNTRGGKPTRNIQSAYVFRPSSNRLESAKRMREKQLDNELDDIYKLDNIYEDEGSDVSCDDLPNLKPGMNNGRKTMDNNFINNKPGNAETSDFGKSSGFGAYSQPNKYGKTETNYGDSHMQSTKPEARTSVKTAITKTGQDKTEDEREFFEQQIMLQLPDFPNASIGSTLSPGYGWAPSLPLMSEQPLTNSNIKVNFQQISNQIGFVIKSTSRLENRRFAKRSTFDILPRTSQ